MTKQAIGIGAAADDGTGDPLRTAFNKANLNFDEIYAFLGGDTLPAVLPAAKGGTGVAFFSVAGLTALRTLTFPDADATLARTDAGQTFTGVQAFNGVAGEGISVAAGTATTDKNAISLTHSWDNAVIAFTAFNLNVTNTASGGGSLLMNLKYGGVSKLSVNPSNSQTLTVANGIGAGGGITGSSLQVGNGWQGISGSSGDSAGALKFNANSSSSERMRMGPDGTLQWNSTAYAGWTAGASSAALDTALYRNAAGVVEVNNGAAGTFRDLKVRQHFVDQTITPAGTTGNQTINKAAGTVNFAAGATSLVVTNSLVTANSTIHAEIRTNDATARIANVVPAAGSFTINLIAPTAETSVGFHVLN